METNNKKLYRHILRNQQNEIDGHVIYTKLAQSCKDPENAKVLSRIAGDEKKHYEILKTYSRRDLAPSRLKIALTVFCAKVLGLSFTLRLMEKSETSAPEAYRLVVDAYPKLGVILNDEDRHGRELVDLLEEEKLNYMGSIVLGLNDALVELSGALAGFTFAIQDSRTIALMGLITGVSASFSMGASEYLSKKQENENNALKASLYTGLAYIVTVILLVLPFFLFHNPFLNLGITIALAIFIIFLFNFYISVAKNLPFRRRFLQMAAISVGVALLSFLIGWLVRTFLGFDI